MSFLTPDEPLIRQLFQPIVGWPCWGTKRIISSIVSLQFGSVAVFSRPSVMSLRNAAEGRENSRSVKMTPPGGEWEFSLLNAAWTIRAETVTATDDLSTDQEIEEVLAALNGQTLLEVGWAAGNKLVLRFREGGTIQASPSSRHKAESTMWWLLQTGGQEISLDGNGLLDISYAEPR